MSSQHEMQPWVTLSRQTVLSQPPFLVVENHVVQLPDGRVIPNWPWVITPDYVNVVAETWDGLFLCFRQTKYAVGGTTLATVGGYLEPGEEPIQAAQRELLEETGCESDEWIQLGTYWVDANRGAGRAHLFLARGARRSSDIHADDLEEQQLLALSRAQIQDALLKGEFRVVPWAAAVALALLYLSQSANNPSSGGRH